MFSVYVYTYLRESLVKASSFAEKYTYNFVLFFSSLCRKMKISTNQRKRYLHETHTSFSRNLYAIPYGMILGIVGYFRSA
jgi:hypothetical protein